MEQSLWLSIKKKESFIALQEYHATLQRLQLSEESKPCYVAAFGRRHKSEVLRYITTAQDGAPGKLQDHTSVHVFRGKGFRIPVVIFDSEIHHRPKHHGETNAGDSLIIRSIVSAGSFSSKTFADKLSVKLFSPICSVFCYFAADFGGLRGVANRLAEQATKRSHDIPNGSLPRVIVVVETVATSFDSSNAEIKLHGYITSAMMALKSYQGESEMHSDLWTHFNSIRVCGLAQTASRKSQSASLKRRLSSTCEEAMESRSSMGFAFKFSHFKALSRMILDKICSNDHRINIFSLSRPRNFCPDDFRQHLDELLRKIPNQAWLWHFVVPLTASCLLLASYPPDCPELPPENLFHRYFQQHCMKAIHQYTIDLSIHSKFITTLKTTFQSLYNTMRETQKSAAMMHIETLTSLANYFPLVKSNRSCFCCLMRMPEKVLDCGHTICDICIRITGSPSVSERYSFEYPECRCCGTTLTRPTFRFIPPTAGLRVLSIDGGGIRGVIPLTYLRHVEEYMKSMGVRLQDQFDFVCGTSAGGLIAIGIFLMQWGVEQCLQKFETFAFDTFCDRSPLAWLRTLISYLKDYKYESDAIEHAFIAGDQKIQMFNPLRTETKIAVTTVPTREAIPYLICNYNGGTRETLKGYRVIRASSPAKDISISDAAACTSAAPWYFKAKFIKHFGTFQDGGLRQNNPLVLAIKEARLIWQKQKNLDFALSLGTGTSKKVDKTMKHLPVRDGFISRLIYSFMSSLDGEREWHEVEDALQLLVPECARDRFYRFNVTFRGPEPGIDDIGSIESLKDLTGRTIQSGEDFTEVTDAISSSMFYFELEDKPTRENGLLQCNGYIYCRAVMDKAGWAKFYRMLKDTCSYFLVAGHPVPCVEGIPRNASIYRRRISFTAENMDDMVNISIRGITRKPRMIGGLPSSLRALANEQQLDAPFGRLDHLSQGKSLPQLPLKRKLYI